MAKNNLKKFISIILVIVLSTAFILSNIASADPLSIVVGGATGLSGAGIFGALAESMGIHLNGTNQQADPVDALWTAANDDPVEIIVSETHKGSGVAPDNYDYIIIDQQGYNNMATHTIDPFVANYSLADFTSGNITGGDTVNGLPMGVFVATCTVDTRVDGQVGVMEAKNFKTTITVTGERYVRTDFYYSGQLLGSSGPTRQGTLGEIVYGMRINKNNNTTVYMNIRTISPSAGGHASSPNITASVQNPISLPYTTDEIDTTIGTDYNNPTIKIPTAISRLTPAFTASDFLAALTTAFLAGQLSQVIIEDTTTPPVPPTPVPVPTTPLGEVPYDEWIDTWGQHVIENQETGNSSLDNIDTNIQTGIDTLDNIDTNIADGVDTLENIDTNIASQNGILGQIRDWMQNGFNTINSTLNSILTGVQSLVQSIVNATENLIAGILNQIPIAFQSAWNTLKQSVSIWHYVVEWVTSISSILTWVWTMASGTSYYIILPVYASLAGAVVLALYKKFGR